jgi:hypothetical protein
LNLITSRRLLMRSLPLLLILGGSLTISGPVLADDDDVKLQDVPTAPRQTIDREVGKGKITEIERDEDGGQVVFEVEFLGTDNQRYEIHVGNDGKLLHKEKD